jgi:hypothetical protein
MQMLVGTGRLPKPAVIGNIEHEHRPFGALHQFTRKDSLVADQR